MIVQLEVVLIVYKLRDLARISMFGHVHYAKNENIYLKKMRPRLRRSHLRCYFQIEYHAQFARANVVLDDGRACLILG